MDDNRKNLIFVGGAAGIRSDAFVDLLNTHSEVCIGKDRFPLQYVLHGNYSPLLFTADRFAEFRYTDMVSSPGSTSDRMAKMETLSADCQTASLVGDRFDGDIEVLGKLLHALPEARCILTLRNLKDVAMDWEDGAVHFSSGQAAEHSFVEGCQHWSEQLAQTQALLATPKIADRILLLDLDHCFEEDQILRQGLLGFMGLEDEPDFASAWDAASDLSKQPKSNVAKVPKTYASIYKRTMTETMRQLRRLAVQQAKSFVPAD